MDSVASKSEAPEAISKGRETPVMINPPNTFTEVVGLETPSSSNVSRHSSVQVGPWGPSL